MITPVTRALPPPTLRPVRTGDEIHVHVQGGVVRRQAPEDGLMVETEEVTHFLELPRIVAALAVLGLAVVPGAEVPAPKAKGRKRPRTEAR